MLFDNLDDYTRELERAAAEQRACDQAETIRRAFSTKPARPLRPAAQDNLFDPLPQARLTFPNGGK